MDVDRYLRTIQDFPKEGIAFKDIAPLLADPEAFQEAIAALDKLTGDLDYTSIGAYDARGFLFAAPLAYRTGKPLFMIRKKGKLPGTVMRKDYDLEYGTATLEIQQDAPLDSVLLIDDVLATGGTMKAGAELIQERGGTVAGCAVLIELAFPKGRELLTGQTVRSLHTIE